MLKVAFLLANLFLDLDNPDWLDFLASQNEHLKKDWSHSKGPMNKHLKPDKDINLNDPRSEVDRLDCKSYIGLVFNGTKNWIFDRKIWI